MDGTTIAYAAAILFAASFVQGLTGFGYGLVAMVLMPLVMGIREATLLVAILGLVPNVVMLVRCGKSYDWRLGWLMLIGVAIACPVGVYFVQSLDEHVLIRALGALIIAFSIRELFWSAAVDRPLPHWTALPLGGLAGLFGSAFNIGGPPAIAYVYSQDWASPQKLAVLQVIFLEIGVLRVVLTASKGAIDQQMLKVSALMLVPMLVAVTLGQWVLQRIPPGRMKRPVFWFLLVMGIKYVVTGIAAVSRR